MKIKNKILFPIIFILAAAGFLGYFLFSTPFQLFQRIFLKKTMIFMSRQFQIFQRIK